MGATIAWYRARSMRERQLMLAMLAILVPLLVYLLLVVPLASAYQAALRDHLAATDRNGRVKVLSSQSGSGRGVIAPGVPDLALYLVDNARQRGIEANAEGSARGVSISVARASPAAVFGWMDALEGAGFSLGSVRIAEVGQGAVSADFFADGARR